MGTCSRLRDIAHGSLALWVVLPARNSGATDLRKLRSQHADIILRVVKESPHGSKPSIACVLDLVRELSPRISTIDVQVASFEFDDTDSGRELLIAMTTAHLPVLRSLYVHYDGDSWEDPHPPALLPLWDTLHSDTLAGLSSLHLRRCGNIELRGLPPRLEDLVLDGTFTQLPPDDMVHAFGRLNCLHTLALSWQDDILAGDQNTWSPGAPQFDFQLHAFSIDAPPYICAGLLERMRIPEDCAITLCIRRNTMADANVIVRCTSALEEHWRHHWHAPEASPFEEVIIKDGARLPWRPYESDELEVSVNSFGPRGPRTLLRVCIEYTPLLLDASSFLWQVGRSDMLAGVVRLCLSASRLHPLPVPFPGVKKLEYRCQIEFGGPVFQLCNAARMLPEYQLVDTLILNGLVINSGQ
ncbi:unnamed protein product [Peniophora sp. CBMAI 1063]|nr:unnamed protein product [Peniophora sp. CBMAI 1063]